MVDYVVKHNGPRYIVTMRGDLTAAKVIALQAELKNAIAKGVRKVVFDLKETSVIDSVGISLLIAVCNSLPPEAEGTQLLNVSAKIAHLLGSLRLTDRLHVQSGMVEASHG